MTSLNDLVLFSVISTFDAAKQLLMFMHGEA